MEHLLKILTTEAQRQITRRTLLIRAGSVVWISSILLGCGTTASQETGTPTPSPSPFASPTPTAVTPDPNLLFTYKGHSDEVYIVA